MGKFSFEEFDFKHYHTTERYAKVVRELYEQAAKEIAAVAAKENFNPDKPFSFKDYPKTARKLKEILNRLAKQVEVVIKKGTEEEWIHSFKKNSAWLQSFVGATLFTQEQLQAFQSRRLEGLKAFQDRKIRGMGLKDRIWKQTEQYQKELEHALDMGLGEGRSAAQLSRDVRQNLRDPNRLFRRVRDKHGNLHLSKNAKAFKPGRGVYRSSYKNAMRLTRTEINMAYRESDWQRWQKLDFVLGYEIRRSNHEPLCECSLCERLVGKYPKWFKFVGWHPQCMCVATPILEDYSSEARHKDRVNKLRSLLYGEEYKKYVSKNTVKDLPDNFKEWFRENEERLENVESVPYFIRDNIHLINPLKKLARRVYDSYDRTVWDDGYFDEDTGGFYISHKLHNFSEEGGGGDAEKEVAKALAMQRKYIEFLPEKGGRDGKKPDAWFDGTTWDVKFMEEANEETIRQYIRDAKKAESVIMFSKRDRYETIRSGIEREIGRQRANGKPIELLPNIYTIIKNEYKLTLVKKIK